MFDILDNTDWSTNTNNLTDQLYPAEYDLVYIDFTDGSDWIQRNAFAVEEVIRMVNERKAAAGSTEQNVLIGVSMGGICSKYALLDMQNTVGQNHDCRLFITYDAPLRGANIPIGVQCLAKFAVDNFGNDIPIINSLTEAINAPTPRQLLLYHVDGVNGIAEPINPTQIAFLAELDGLGSLGIRHVAISNGAANGTFQENDILPGGLMFDLNATKENYCKESGGVIVCGLLTVGVALRATGEYTNTKVMIANATLHLDGPINLQVASEVNCFTKPYDVSPGANSNLGISALSLTQGAGGLGTGLIEAGFTIEEASHLFMKHHCFEPTFSSLGSGEPGTMRSSVTCGTPTLCSNPTVAETNRFTGEAEFNQEHIFLDARIALLIVDELVTNSPPPAIHPLTLSGTLNTYFNVGLSIYSPIPTVTIGTSNGKLSINNTGKVAFATGNEPFSPHDLLIADTKCDAVITVENGAKLEVGADLSAKHGELRINDGAIVHIKSGGTLYVTSSLSKLYIKHGATLILDAGAIVQLESAGSNILIEGDLVVNGDIVFKGLGYFDFGLGNKLVYGPGYNNFKLSGAGKDNRFVRISGGLAIDASHRLNWSNGLVEVAEAVYVTDGAGLDFTNMTLHGSGWITVIEASNSGAITLLRCKVDFLNQAINGDGFYGCTIDGCAFSDYENYQVFWTNALAVVIRNSTFDGGGAFNALLFDNVAIASIKGSSFEGHGTPLSGNFDDADLFGVGAAVQLENVTACLVENSYFGNNSIGIKASEVAQPSNVYTYRNSTFYNNAAGIFVNGDATRGTVLSDCSVFDINKNGIRGIDIALMIDSWNSKTFAFDTDSPNRFIADNFAPGGVTASHVRICYDQKSIGGSRLMRNNSWSFSGGAADIAPEHLIFLLDVACSINTAPVLQPFATRLPECATDERPSSFAVSAPGSECTLNAGGTVAHPISVHEQFHLGAFLMRADSVEAGIEALRPVAALWQSNLTAFSENCQQYIKVAKAFVDGIDLQILPRSANKPNQINASSNLLIAPNPANGSAMLHLSAEEHQIKAWDAQGRLMLLVTASGNYSLETATWMPGIYLIDAVTSNGLREIGKLVVSR